MDDTTGDEFINDSSPDWYLPKQRMLAEIDAALSPAARKVAPPNPTPPNSSA